MNYAFRTVAVKINPYASGSKTRTDPLQNVNKSIHNILKFMVMLFYIITRNKHCNNTCNIKAQLLIYFRFHEVSDFAM